MEPERTVKKERYFIIYKPANMVSQFVSPHQVRLLGDLDFDFPERTHAVGRLDNNSEGLLILTTNKKVTSLLFSGANSHERVYLVQVNNTISENSLDQLRKGVTIRVAGGEHYVTPGCETAILAHPEEMYPHISLPKQYGECSWLSISLYEGKYRQVRKMMTAVHHRCKRLIRVRIEDLLLGNLQPGAVQEIEEMEFFKKLRIGPYSLP